MRKSFFVAVLLLVGSQVASQTIDVAWSRVLESGSISGSVADYMRHLTLDEAGNVYVAGSRREISSDFVTLKYSSSGALLWENAYNGDENSGDLLQGCVVDASGNVYVAGTAYNDPSTDMSSWVTIKYSPSGGTEWVRKYNPSQVPLHLHYVCGIALDNEGNIVVAGSVRYAESYYNYAIIKYSPAGEIIWVRNFKSSNTPTGSPDYAQALAIDGTNSVYVTGIGPYSITTVKYFPDGTLVWERSYGHSNLGVGGGYRNAIAIDPAGNVGVAGYRGTTHPDPFSDVVRINVCVYDPEGQVRWTRELGGNDSGFCFPYDIAFDLLGNLVVAGEVSNAGTGADGLVAKFSPTGETLWRREIVGTNRDVCLALAIDSTGNTLVAATSGLQDTWRDTLVTVKYTPSGDVAWTKRQPGASAGDIAPIGSNSVYVTGSAAESPSWGATMTDGVTLKLIENYCCGDFTGNVDCDGAGQVDIADLSALIDNLFLSFQPLCCVGEANLDGDEAVGIDISDLSAMIDHLYLTFSPLAGCP